MRQWKSDIKWLLVRILVLFRGCSKCVNLTPQSLGTQKVNVYRSKFLYGSRTVWLVDTPGFDDTYRSDNDVLRAVAEWFSMSYKQKITPNGILYLHQITMNRMLGSAQKSLIMFYKLCGKNYFDRVCIVTTRWDEVDEATGSQRESDLKHDQNFWGEMIRQGARTVRHQNTPESARRVISDLIQSHEGQPCSPLNIQRQMVDEGKPLHETAAGAEVAKELLEQQRKHEQEKREWHAEWRKALSDKDRELAKTMEEQQKRSQAQIERCRQDLEAFKSQARLLHDNEEKMRRDLVGLLKDESHRRESQAQTQVQAAQSQLQAQKLQNQRLQEQLQTQAQENWRRDKEQKAEAQSTQAQLQAQTLRNQQLQQRQRDTESEHRRQIQQLQKEIVHLSRPNSPESMGNRTVSTRGSPSNLSSAKEKKARPLKYHQIHCSHPAATIDGHCDECGLPPNPDSPHFIQNLCYR